MRTAARRYSGPQIDRNAFQYIPRMGNLLFYLLEGFIHETLNPYDSERPFLFRERNLDRPQSPGTSAGRWSP